MHFSFALLATAASAMAAAQCKGYNPFPLKEDGFPNPTPKQLAGIEKRAGGNLPGGALPSHLTDDATAALQLIAFNENFEVAYFHNLITNITTSAKGYTNVPNKDFALKSLNAIQAQEELHAIGANAILANAKRTTISPCVYNFPVTTFPNAIALANTFTDLVLSVLPGAQELFGTDGGEEEGLVELVGSIIAQEGQQDGWYRTLQGKNPSAAPFLTGSSPVFAFSALQSFIAPGSCEKELSIIGHNIHVLPPLGVSGKLNGKDETLTFTVHGENVISSKNSIVYLTGQDSPIVAPIRNIRCRKGVTTFEAGFPFSSLNFSHGLTVAAVIKGQHAPTVAAAAKAAVFGPGLIEVA